MTEKAVLRDLADLARPLDRDAMVAAPTEGCLSDDALEALLSGEPADEATVRCLGRHVPECPRCRTLLAVLLGERPLGDLDRAAAAVDRAVARRLAAMPLPERLRIRDRVVGLVLAWLPSPTVARPALAGAFADEDDTAGTELVVMEEDRPLTVRLSSPEGPAAGFEVVLLDAEGAEAFRARTDETGAFVFPGPAGAYSCQVAGYDGPLLREADS